MLPLAPDDAHGHPLKVGDQVELRAVPPEVEAGPAETRAVFAAAVGRTFRIAGFNAFGLAQLDVTGRPAYDTIWVEPRFLSRRTKRGG